MKAEIKGFTCENNTTLTVWLGTQPPTLLDSKSAGYYSKDEARPLAASLLARATKVATITPVEGKTPLAVILEALYA